MQIEKKIYIGNKVKTNKKFKPIDQDGNKVDLGKKVLEGTVIGKRGTFLFMNFHQELPFTHYLNGLLPAPTGYAVKQEEITPIDIYKTKDKQKQDFFNLITEFKYKELEKIPKQIKASDNIIYQKTNNIKNLLRDINIYESDIRQEEFAIKKLEKKKASISVKPDYIMKQYDKMKKNKKIDKIAILNTIQSTNLLLTTKNLTYKNTNSNMPPYILGAYKILIPIDETEKIKIINFKKHVQKFRYHHPCIMRGEVCLGHAMISEVEKLRNTGNIINLIHLLINFLEEPNYGDPHLSEELFYCSQKVTIKPKEEIDWFNENYWTELEVWDAEKYTEDTKKIQQKLRNNN